MVAPDKFANKLRHLMGLRGLNASELAKKIERSRQQLSPYLNGKRIPDRPVLELLASALDSTVEDLLAEEGSREQPDPRALRLEGIALILRLEGDDLALALERLRKLSLPISANPAGAAKKAKPTAG